MSALVPAEKGASVPGEEVLPRPATHDPELPTHARRDSVLRDSRTDRFFDLVPISEQVNKQALFRQLMKIGAGVDPTLALRLNAVRAETHIWSNPRSTLTPERESRLPRGVSPSGEREGTPWASCARYGTAARLGDLPGKF